MKENNSHVGLGRISRGPIADHAFYKAPVNNEIVMVTIFVEARFFQSYIR